MKKNAFYALLFVLQYTLAQTTTPQFFLDFEEGQMTPNISGVTLTNGTGDVTFSNNSNVYTQTPNTIVPSATGNELFMDYEGYMFISKDVLVKRNFTISFNYRREASTSWYLGLISFVGKEGGNWVNKDLLLSSPDGTVSGFGLTATNALPVNEEHYVTLTHKEGTFSFYIDGQLVASSTNTDIMDMSKVKMYLSFRPEIPNPNSNNVVPYKVNGHSKNTQAYFDKLALYNVALTAGEVASNYNDLGIADIDIYTNQPQQNVTYGGDGKLTIKDWAEKNVTATAQKLYGDMNLTVLRIPVFALQPITDPIYDNVITVVNAVKAVNPNVKIFASIANGDGYDDNDLHGVHKFPSSWSGCCPYNVYDLNLTAYAAYLDSFMTRMSNAGITVDILGPWNEDPADDSDHQKIFDQMTQLGNTQTIGVERWALQSSVNDVDDIEDRVDFVGSHFYDDDQIAETEWESKWKELVDKSEDPVWFTEATRYKTDDGIARVIDGFSQIIPSMNGGASNVTFYQVVKRFVYANGNALPIKYSAYKNLVNNSKGALRVSSTSNINVKRVVFANNNTLDVHIVNKDTEDHQTRIKILEGFKATGLITRTTWDANHTETVDTFDSKNLSQILVTSPAYSYCHYKITLDQAVSGSSTNNSTVNKEVTVVLGNQVEDIKVYPNPCSGNNLNIELPLNLREAKSMNIAIYSMYGKQIYSENSNVTNHLKLNTSLKAGMYLISVTVDGKKYDKKLVVNK